jgi:hypothetical protein
VGSEAASSDDRVRPQALRDKDYGRQLSGAATAGPVGPGHPDYVDEVEDADLLNEVYEALGFEVFGRSSAEFEDWVAEDREATEEDVARHIEDATVTAVLKARAMRRTSSTVNRLLSEAEGQDPDTFAESVMEIVSLGKLDGPDVEVPPAEPPAPALAPVDFSSVFNNWSCKVEAHAGLLVSRLEALASTPLGSNMSLVAYTRDVYGEGPTEMVDFVTWWIACSKKGRAVRADPKYPRKYKWPTSAICPILEFTRMDMTVIHPDIGIECKKKEEFRADLPEWALLLKSMWNTSLGNLVQLDADCSWCASDRYEELGPPVTCALCQCSWHVQCAARFHDEVRRAEVVLPALPDTAQDWLPPTFRRSVPVVGVALPTVDVMCLPCRQWILAPGGHPASSSSS